MKNEYFQEHKEKTHKSTRELLLFDDPNETMEKYFHDLKNGHSFRENGIWILENLNKHW